MPRTAKNIESRGNRVIRFIETHCRVPEGKLVGKPIKLIPEQRKFVLDVFDNPHGTKTGIYSTARKNAKTALMACLLLAFVIGPEKRQNARFVSGALSRKQAAEVYNYASKIIMLNPDLQKVSRLVPSQKQIFGLVANTEYQAMSSEAKTAMGGSPLVAILDEIGQIQGPKDDYIDAITTSQGAHENPLLLYMSTQAATDGDYFSIIIDDALKGDDPHTVCHLYAADPDCDLMDESQWYKANPALGKFLSLDYVRNQMEAATRMPSKENTVRNLILNQRISTNSPFISKSSWQSCGGEKPPLEECIGITAGLDLSGKTDLTALVLQGFHPESGTWAVYPYFWTPERGLEERAKRDRAPYGVWHKQGYLRTTPGATVDYEYVATEIVEILADVNLESLGFDRWRIAIIQKEFERIGVDLPWKEIGQGFKDMSPALDGLESKVLNATLRHGDHPVLNMCAQNAMVSRDPAGNRKLDKMKTSGRIDGIVALAMAEAVSQKQEIDSGGMEDFLSNPLVFS